MQFKCPSCCQIWPWTCPTCQIRGKESVKLRCPSSCQACPRSNTSNTSTRRERKPAIEVPIVLSNVSKNLSSMRVVGEKEQPRCPSCCPRAKEPLLTRLQRERTIAQLRCLSCCQSCPCTGSIREALTHKHRCPSCFSQTCSRGYVTCIHWERRRFNRGSWRVVNHVNAPF